MAVTIATNGLAAFTNDIDARAQTILSLVKQYIPGFVDRRYGWRAQGTMPSEIQFPLFRIVPMSVVPKMYATGKWKVSITYDLWMDFTEDNETNLTTLQASGVSAVMKLFSQNALADGSTKFKQYQPGTGAGWNESEMVSFRMGPPYKGAFAVLAGKQYQSVAVLTFQIADEVIL